MGPIRCPETSVSNYHTTPCNNPEDHRFHEMCILYSIDPAFDHKPNIDQQMHNISDVYKMHLKNPTYVSAS
jgi:hypothetical protein